MSNSRFLALLGLCVPLLLCSCPGDETEAANPALDASVQEELDAATEAFDSTVDEVAGEIEEAADAASSAIDESNAADALEELSKELDSGN